MEGVEGAIILFFLIYVMECRCHLESVLPQIRSHEETIGQ